MAGLRGKFSSKTDTKKRSSCGSKDEEELDEREVFEKSAPEDELLGRIINAAEEIYGGNDFLEKLAESLESEQNKRNYGGDMKMYRNYGMPEKGYAAYGSGRYGTQNGGYPERASGSGRYGMPGGGYAVSGSGRYGMPGGGYAASGSGRYGMPGGGYAASGSGRYGMPNGGYAAYGPGRYGVPGGGVAYGSGGYTMPNGGYAAYGPGRYGMPNGSERAYPMMERGYVNPYGAGLQSRNGRGDIKKEAEYLSEIAPDFDLSESLQNKVFRNVLAAGGSLLEAYAAMIKLPEDGSREQIIQNGQSAQRGTGEAGMNPAGMNSDDFMKYIDSIKNV